MKVEKSKALQEVVKVSETVYLLAVEIKKLRQKNKRLRRLLREGLGLIERFERRSKNGEKISE